jgi:hypothetical protein
LLGEIEPMVLVLVRLDERDQHVQAFALGVWSSAAISVSISFSAAR